MLASAAIKNAFDGFPMTVASMPHAYCKQIIKTDNSVNINNAHDDR